MLAQVKYQWLQYAEYGKNKREFLVCNATLAYKHFFGSVVACVFENMHKSMADAVKRIHVSSLYGSYRNFL